MARTIVLSPFVAAALAAALAAARQPPAPTPYDDDADHLWNRVFGALWVAELSPAEVAAALPGEGPADLQVGWVHHKRAGRPEDRRWFGGDGRLLPLEGLAAAAAATLRSWLVEVAAQPPPPLAAELRLLFQHDLLRAAQRLLETGENADLVPLLWQAALAVAPAEATFAALADPLAAALAGDGPTARFAGRLPPELGGSATGYREVLRKSTRLFDAGRSLLWSRVWLRHPDGEPALAALLTPAGLPAADRPVPLGFAAVLAQGLVAVDRRGNPRRTPIVVDVRTQVLRNRDGLAASNDTFTRDGIHFEILHLERGPLRRFGAAMAYRAVDPDDQDLFRDYGTSKHTTFRAQCALCHRNTGTPEPWLGGFPVLRAHAEPRLAVRGDERLELAEREVAAVAARWSAGR